jgi:hypothetical protein
MNIPRVYIAGPYTADNGTIRRLNAGTAVKLGRQVIRTGCFPVIPHITGIECEDIESRWEWWMRATSDELRTCAAMVVVPCFAQSKGTALEIVQCHSEGRPVFYSDWHSGSVVIRDEFFSWLDEVRR